ncbi:hypothetical protein LTS10_002827 [Elasticomyces elasticus]|nr:hypothetical protein LTS10_002827 [Elasticomyces elasticus]
MRLINIDTLKFAEFYDDAIPAYAILSHRWTTDELTYADFRKGRRKESVGYEKVLRLQEVTQRYNAWLEHRKVEFAPEAAHEVGTPVEQPVKYVWLDTCCIDKRSSAELSEAINSMYSYYSNAQICFAHLADVHAAEIDGDDLPPVVERMMRESVWFTRGWTLQEMIAPGRILFCDEKWTFFAHKCRNVWLYERKHQCNELPTTCHVNKILAEITGVAPAVTGSERAGSSALEIFGWASHRTTSRVEDMSYCLLGLLGINMPLLYGEGSLAFRRLQEAIMVNSSDETFFAFHSVEPYRWGAPILAEGVRDFVCVSSWKPKGPRTRLKELLVLGGGRPSSKTIANGTLRFHTEALRLHGPKGALKDHNPEYWLVPVSVLVQAWGEENRERRIQFAVVLESAWHDASRHRRVSNAQLPNNIYKYAVNIGQSFYTGDNWRICRWRRAWAFLNGGRTVTRTQAFRQQTFAIDLTPPKS